MSIALIAAIGCSSSEPTVIEKEVVVEKEVIKEVQVPGETVIVKEEVVREVEVPGETVVVEKEVVKEVEVPGETVVVEKQVEVEVMVTAVPDMMSDEPAYGGTIRFGVIDQGTLDPMLAGLSAGQAPYGELTYDNVVMYWWNGDVTPWAVESWSSADDLSQYTLQRARGNQVPQWRPSHLRRHQVHAGPHQGRRLRFAPQGPDFLYRHD